MLIQDVGALVFFELRLCLTKMGSGGFQLAICGDPPLTALSLDLGPQPMTEI